MNPTETQTHARTACDFPRNVSHDARTCTGSCRTPNSNWKCFPRGPNPNWFVSSPEVFTRGPTPNWVLISPEVFTRGPTLNWVVISPEVFHPNPEPELPTCFRGHLFEREGEEEGKGEGESEEEEVGSSPSSPNTSKKFGH